MGKLNRNLWVFEDENRERLDRLLRERGGEDGMRRSADGTYVWQPQADVFESAMEWTIQVELPGLTLEDVILESKGHELLVYGERRFVKDVDGPAYHTLERSYGPFARRFILPKGLDAGGVRAVLRDGLLTVTVPKKPQKKTARQIPIAD